MTSRRTAIGLGASALSALALRRPGRATAATPAPAAPSAPGPAIELTWEIHSCVRVTRGDATLVIDPGLLSADHATDGADALLYTHEHLDHYNAAKLSAAAAARPGLRVYTNKSLAAQIKQSGVAPGARIHAVGDGDHFEVGGIPVSVHGEWHALIHKDIPRVRNVGFIVGDGFFHPGDALTDPGTHVKLLACPLLGLYTKDGTTVDWIRQLVPAQVAPVHDSGLIPLALTTLDQFFGPDPGIGPGTGAPYFRPVPGTPFPL
jgi:hypothetical protein